MLTNRNLQIKLKEIVDIFDLESIPNKEKIKNMVKNNRAISIAAKHLPKK